MRMTGKIVNWNADKAFGFIQPNGGGDEIFIHKTALSNRSRTPLVNDTISFLLSTDNEGRYCAVKATFIGEKILASHPMSLSTYIATTFLAALSLAVVMGYAPKNLLIIYLVLSTVTYLAYWIDKSKAKKGKWRTQESTLHMLSLIGGWPGAAFAQQSLRHKSQKQKFRIVYWANVVVNILALIWLLSESGSKWLALLQ